MAVETFESSFYPELGMQFGRFYVWKSHAMYKVVQAFMRKPYLKLQWIATDVFLKEKGLALP